MANKNPEAKVKWKGEFWALRCSANGGGLLVNAKPSGQENESTYTETGKEQSSIVIHVNYIFNRIFSFFFFYVRKVLESSTIFQK